jgi:uncharacterized membrane protein YgcG
MVPRFKEGNYDQGLLDGITATVDILKNKENSKYFIEMNTVDTSLDEEIKNNDTVILAFVFFVIILISFFVKRSRKTFADLYKGPSTNQKDKQKNESPLIISKSRWLILYGVIPAVLFLSIYSFFGVENYPFILLSGLYLYLVFILLEKRIRSNHQYKKTSVENDFYGNYTKYTKAHEYWWWVVIFFPLPFLFYIFFYLSQKRQLRNHHAIVKAVPML